MCNGHLCDECKKFVDVEDIGMILCSNCASKAEESARSAAPNSAMDAIAALADKWCDATNQPDSICVALYWFTKWARQQHQ